MATVIGLFLMVGGIAVLAIVRPWRLDSSSDAASMDAASMDAASSADETTVLPRIASGPAPSRAAGRTPSPRAPRPRPSPMRRRAERHRIEMIPRGRHVPGRPEIPLPDWLGPVSGGPR